MTRQQTYSSPGKVEGVDGCVRLIPREVSQQRIHVILEGEIHTFRRYSETAT